jgi:hypothetical protein
MQRATRHAIFRRVRDSLQGREFAYAASDHAIDSTRAFLWRPDDRTPGAYRDTGTFFFVFFFQVVSMIAPLRKLRLTLHFLQSFVAPNPQLCGLRALPTLAAYFT